MDGYRLAFIIKKCQGLKNLFNVFDGICLNLQLLGGAGFISLDDDMSNLCICSGLLSGLKNEQFEIVHPTKAKPIISCILDEALRINER